VANRLQLDGKGRGTRVLEPKQTYPADLFDCVPRQPLEGGPSTVTPRQVLFWIHLSAGVVAGIVILIMSVTGILLAYERQVANWSARSYHSSRPSADTRRLSADVLIAKAREYAQTAEPSTLTVLSDPSAPVSVRLGRERTLYLDAYTGSVLGEGSRKLQ